MDSHDVGRGRPDDYFSALNSVQQPVLVLGIRSDVLYPINEQEELHKYLGNSEFHVIESDEGHDGFLLALEEVRLRSQRFACRSGFGPIESPVPILFIRHSQALAVPVWQHAVRSAYQAVSQTCGRR